MRVMVTGAAGFIGSHLCDRLLSLGNEVLGVDNLSAGRMENLPKHKKFRFERIDIRDNGFQRLARGIDEIYHLAADPLVKESAERPVESFDINARGTLCVLEAARKSGVNHLVFTSTSAVYGDAVVFPTPETEPMMPISNYAASKIAAESYVSSYASTYGIGGTVFRFANIFGPRGGHGVMHDFYFKLKGNPKELEILGNGKQTKSYLYVSDCVEATILAQEKQKAAYDFFNLGTERTADVNEIADIVSAYLGAKPKRRYTGGKRGWVGDVSKMRLDVRKIKKLTGWKPKVSLEKGVKLYLDWLSKEKQ